ncbi:MAG: hypothetical protein ACFFDS_07925 [Candidatus Thorarchaeota archaeon]
MFPTNLIIKQLEEDYLEEGIIFAKRRIIELENNLLFIQDMLNQSLHIIYNQLKDKQKAIFYITSKLLKKDTISINKLSEKIAEKMNLSFSTAKWNITRLRDLGLLETNGQRGNIKTTISLTHIGFSLYLALSQSKKRTL